MRESRKTPGNVSMFWRALWGQTLRQSSGWVEVVGGGGQGWGDFHAMRESRKTPGNVSMFWRALWGQTLRQSGGGGGGGGRAGGIFMP